MECGRTSSPEELVDSWNGECNIPLRAFSSEELLKATNNFHPHNIITEDAFYLLYRGSFEECPVLVKKFGKEGSFWPHEDINLYATHDMATTSQVCNHRNVLKIIGCCLEFQFPTLVYECETSIQVLSNDLYEMDRSSDNLTLAWETRLSIANDIASALVHLHTAFSTPIVNRNLKPGNIIIDQNGVAKLVDFSLAIRIPPGESQVEDIVVGPYGFAEPKYVATGIVTVKTDVYAFGMIMLELLTGKRTVDANRGGSHLDNHVKIYANKDQLNKVVDARMIGDGIGVDQEQQFRAFVELALRCVEEKREDKPEMKGVADELSRIRRSVDAN
ncbi:hypothetical protein RHGRI_013858 [Rhododendron griersonianum]|uniref:Protein kinase domain-containing protein n=1 Tax=Rhododendron griersonianum TaxID=479676 RepID=A0AAV6K7N1_9ERIC|nr:hypothetical protein RHGRI_013858 [Rhododendron griersonianum]